jgi:hypothetical protein
MFHSEDLDHSSSKYPGLLSDAFEDLQLLAEPTIDHHLNPTPPPG